MIPSTIGDRVEQFRKHFKLTQTAFGQELGMKRGNITKIENNKIPPSKTFLKAVKERFAGNPEWIKTGEGEMFIAPEEYIAEGISFLGLQRYGQGLVKILYNPQFAELKSIVAVGEMSKESIDPKLEAYLQYILDKWNQGDETVRGWLMIQLGIAFQEVAKKLQEEKK
jgi:transcriptional regulator with XRE-family HTH domain